MSVHDRWFALMTAVFATTVSLSVNSQGNTTNAAIDSVEERKELSTDQNHKAEKRSEGLELVKTHLQELVPILDQLKINSSGQYEKAVRDLDHASRRLDSIKRRDKKLYEISLREWKTRCQVDLLKAKLKVQKSSPDQERVVQRQKALREIEIERVNRELALLETREKSHHERIAQTRQVLEKFEVRRQQLLTEKEKLMNTSIDTESTHPKASHPSKKNSVGADLPAAASSKKDKK